MKKNIKNIIILTLSLCLLFNLITCSPIRRQPLEIGDSVTINQNCVIILNTAYAYPVDDTTYVLELNFSFNVNNYSLLLTQNDISISYSQPQKVNWNNDLTIEKNEYNILEQPIKSPCSYTFLFFVPKNPYFQNLDLLHEDSLGYTINSLVFDKTFTLYTKNLIQKI